MRRRRRKPTKRLLILALALFLGSSFFCSNQAPTNLRSRSKRQGWICQCP